MSVTPVPPVANRTLPAFDLVAKVLGFLVSFELVFVLFLFAGRYKNDPRFEWVPVDLTALFFLASVVVGVFVILRDRKSVPPRANGLLVAFGGFVVYTLASLLWTPGVVYAQQKAFYIATLTAWTFIASLLIISPSHERLNRFLAAIVLLAFWLGFETFANYVESGGIGVVTALGGNYLGVGVVLGLGASIFFYNFMYFQRNIVLRSVALVFFITYIILLLLVGARGPLIATMLACAMPAVLGLRLSMRSGLQITRYAWGVFAILGVVFLGIGYMYTTGNTTTTLSRLLVLLEPDMGESAGVRYQFYLDAPMYWLESPIIGHGIGSWPLLIGIQDVKVSVHNIVLEILVELGAIGLALFAFIVFQSLRLLGPLDAIRKEPIRMLLVALFVNVFFYSFVSDDIAENRLMFALLGILPRRQAADDRGEKGEEVTAV